MGVFEKLSRSKACCLRVMLATHMASHTVVVSYPSISGTVQCQVGTYAEYRVCASISLYSFLLASKHILDKHIIRVTT